MSVNHAKSFVERLQNDQDFMNRISACKDQKARLEVAKSEGFDFTPDDLLRLRAEQTSNHDIKSLIEKKLAGEFDDNTLKQKLEDLELTEEELSKVVGGGDWWNPASCMGWGCDILYCY